MTKMSKDANQVDRFRQAARELGCDESEERFDAALRAVAKHKPKDEAGTRKPRPERAKRG